MKAASVLRRVVAPQKGLRNFCAARLEKDSFKSQQAVGTLKSIDGTVATCVPSSAQASVAYNSIVLIQTGRNDQAHGIVFNLEKDGSVGLILLDNISNIRAGQSVFATERLFEIPVGFGVLGKVVDTLGRVVPTGTLFQRNTPLLNEVGLVDAMAPDIVSRSPVNYNLLTGYKVVDTLFPIGRGQRELILGDRQTGKTSIAISSIINQTRVNNEVLSKNGVLNIYVSVGQRMSNVARIYSLLSKFGAMKYTVIMSATASEPAGMQYLAPYSGAALGEAFMAKGRHGLIVYDDLSKQAVAYRQISLLLRRPPGREAYPGDVFYLHSRLLERAAALSPGRGSGSLTALPIVETLSNDVTAYIVTNVISITDGQIYLDAKLFTGGQRPSVHIGLSVSRVGSKAQNKAYKEVGGEVKKLIGEYRKIAGDSVGAGGGFQSPALIRGSRFIQLFNQKGPSYFINAVVSLYACLQGFMDEVKLPYVKFYEYLLVNKDLAVAYGNATNKFFYMYNSSMNYMVRYLTLDHPLLKAEVDNMLEQHTSQFLTQFQAKMNLIKSEAEQLALKNLLYACKRVV
jgi:proton translocating ATP synthase F1 alpha subunit